MFRALHEKPSRKRYSKLGNSLRRFPTINELIFFHLGISPSYHQPSVSFSTCNGRHPEQCCQSTR